MNVLKDVLDAYIEAYWRSAMAEGHFYEKIFVGKAGKVWVETMSRNQKPVCADTGECLEVEAVEWGWFLEVEGVFLISNEEELGDFVDFLEDRISAEDIEKAKSILDKEGFVVFTGATPLTPDELKGVVEEIAVEDFEANREYIEGLLERFLGGERLNAV